MVLLTDDDRPANWLDAVASLPKGSAVIVRAREPERREALARAIQKVAKPRRIQVLIADDPKLALRIRASGIHTPERNALKIGGYRRAMPMALLSVSAHGTTGVIRASYSIVDAAFLSPMFATASHPVTHALKPIRWSMAARAGRTPVFALGGIDANTVRHAVVAGANGLGLIGGWITAKN